MRVTLLVFSQTGNTMRVAEVMTDALEAHGHEVLLLRTSLFGPDETELQDADLLIVGSPSFFSRAPSVVRQYLAALPALGGLRAAVFATSGGASGRTLWDLRRGLERRGARVLGGAVFPGEVSYPVHSLKGRHEGLPGPAELERAVSFARTIAEAAAFPATGRPGASTAPAGDSPLSGGPSPAAALSPSGGRSSGGAQAAAALPRTSRGLWGFYGLLGVALRPGLLRRVLRVPVVDPAVCNRCRWCVGACPVGAIALEQVEERRMRPTDGGTGQPAPHIDPEVCIRCYRCLACPIDAYSLEWRSGAEPLIALLYHRSLVARFGDPEARGVT